MTEEERQVVRESWKHALPEEYDVFCFGNFVCNEDMVIPGTLYVSGGVDTSDLTTHGALIVDGFVDAIDIIVLNGHFICTSGVSACDISVFNGDLMSNSDLNVYDINIHNGNCIVHHTIDSYAIEVNNGLLDCYDVDTNGKAIHAADYVCRYYEEEI